MKKKLDGKLAMSEVTLLWGFAAKAISLSLSAKLEARKKALSRPKPKSSAVHHCSIFLFFPFLFCVSFSLFLLKKREENVFWTKKKGLSIVFLNFFCLAVNSFLSMFKMNKRKEKKLQWNSLKYPRAKRQRPKIIRKLCF